MSVSTDKAIGVLTAPRAGVFDRHGLRVGQIDDSLTFRVRGTVTAIKDVAALTELRDLIDRHLTERSKSAAGEREFAL